MSEIALNTAPSRQQIAAKGRSAPLRVTGKLRVAIDAMVWQCLARADAAKHAGMTEYSLYSAFRKPHVKAHYLSELEVLRTSERARNIHTLVEVRDQTTNQMARVQAVKELEQSAETAARSTGSLSLPGLTIQIINAAAPEVKVIDHE